MMVVKKHGAGRRLGAFDGGDGGAVEEIDVEPAIIVVIEKSNAGARSLDDGRFFERAGAVVKFVKAGLMSDVDENDLSIVNKAACSDRTRVRILDGSVNAAGGHARRTRQGNIL